MSDRAEIGLQYLVKFRSGQDYAHVADADGEVPVIGSGGPFARASAHLYEGESVLFGRKGTVDRPLHIDGKFWTVDTMFYTELSNAVDGRWLYYWATTVPFGLYSTDTALPSMTSSVLGRLKVPVVDIDKQRAIAGYLDRETGDIDAMLSKMDELAENLRVRRASIGSPLHTMGFEHVRLQWLMHEVDDRAGNSNADLPLLSVSIHHGVQLREESSSRQQASTDLSKYKVVRAGEIVLNRMRAFQGGLGQARIEGLVSPDYAVLHPEPRLSPDWAEYVMRSPQFVDAMSQRLRGIGAADQSNVRTPRINVRDLFILSIPLPPLDEQIKIADQLDEATARVDAMLAKVADLKALLLERRAALITDVVTGRKEVA